MDSVFDDWGMYNRECTSFSAWRLYNRSSFNMPFHADASSWAAHSKNLGYSVNSMPSVGSIAVTSTHVAWVEVVDVAKATVMVEDYNYGRDGTYNERIMSASAAQYIHFQDMSESQQPNLITQQFKGKMVRNSVGSIAYVAKNGLRYWVPSMSVVTCLGGMGNVSQVSDTTFNTITPSPNAANCLTRYVDKLIRSPNGTISYVNTNHSKHWVPNMKTVNCLGGSVNQVDYTIFNNVPNASTGASCGSQFVGRLIRAPDGTISYVDSNNQQHWIPNMDVLACLGGLGAVINMDWQPFDQFPVSNPATCSTR